MEACQAVVVSLSTSNTWEEQQWTVSGQNEECKRKVYISYLWVIRFDTSKKHKKTFQDLQLSLSKHLCFSLEVSAAKTLFQNSISQLVQTKIVANRQHLPRNPETQWMFTAFVLLQFHVIRVFVLSTDSCGCSFKSCTSWRALKDHVHKIT